MVSNNLITKMKKLLNNILLLAFPLLYIGYILYIRIFLVRDPRLLYVKMSFISIIITAIVILSLLLRIYNLLKKEGIIMEKPLNNKFLLWITDIVIQFYYFIASIWYNFYTLFIKNSLKVNLILAKFAKYLHKHTDHKFALMILVIFELLPKVILLATFLFDIFYGQQFYYFYKVLFLLLLPLMFSVMRTILMVFHEDNFDALDSYITQIPSVDIYNNFKISYAFEDNFQPPDFVKNIDDFVENHYLPIKYIPNVVAFFEIITMRYKLNLIYLIILILHLLGWLTILFFGIYV